LSLQDFSKIGPGNEKMNPVGKAHTELLARATPLRRKIYNNWMILASFVHKALESLIVYFTRVANRRCEFVVLNQKRVPAAELFV
jgi:hypothetical protein